MPINLFDEKVRLLEQFKQETANQINFLHGEEAEAFRKSVDCCTGIISNWESLQAQNDSLTEEQNAYIQQIFTEISSMRKKMEPSLFAYYNKLQNKVLTKRRHSMAVRGYEREHTYSMPPSIFFDQKK